METTKEIAINRMDCPTCIITLEKSVMKVKGVKSARGNYLKKTLKVTFNDSTPLIDIEKAIEDVGYQVAYKKYSNPISRLRGIFNHERSKAITSITDDDFAEKILRSTKIVAVLFSSDTCPSCQMLKPKLSELAERLMDRVAFYEMDVAHSETWKDTQERNLNDLAQAAASIDSLGCDSADLAGEGLGDVWIWPSCVPLHGKTGLA